MNMQKIVTDILEGQIRTFDPKEGMIQKWEVNQCGYHSKMNGVIHHVRDTAGLASGILLYELEQYYEIAFQALHRLCDIQDTRIGSPTFGLWSYYLEEDLEHMIEPDYNWANFIGRELLTVCILCKDKLPADLEVRLHRAIQNAMQCTIKRNVAADYTNISLMSNMTLVSAGELLQDEHLFHIGKDRLKRLYEYTKFTTSFSEYNSSGYIMVDMEEISRMQHFFKDEECRFIADELNYYAWEMLASHYNTAMDQLAPPQMRAYKDIDTGILAWYIWQGTEGKYGKCMETFPAYPAPTYYFLTKCPSKCLPLLEKTHEFIAHTYYRKNNIRLEHEDTVVVRELDSPDLTAYTYKTPYYSMGSFAFCDCWNQRRNAMIIWDKDAPKTFRLRSIHNNYDFCSGVVHSQQENNRILGHMGLVSDRGSFIYTLDKVKNGIYQAENLGFRFELGGNCDQLTIKQAGKDFLIDDGSMHIRLHIEKWVYDGCDAEIKLSEDGKAVILVGYEGPNKTLDTNTLDDTYGIFTLTAFYGTATDTERNEEDTSHEVICQVLPNHKVESRWQGMQVESNCRTVPYRKALGLD